MPLADMEAWEIPTLLDEPKPLHFLWFMIQYVIGVLMKMPFYWHLIYWFFFADVFLCFFCQYLDGMHGFIRDHQKIANLPVETMQRTGKLILKLQYSFWYCSCSHRRSTERIRLRSDRRL